MRNEVTLYLQPHPQPLTLAPCPRAYVDQLWDLLRMFGFLFTSELPLVWHTYYYAEMMIWPIRSHMQLFYTATWSAGVHIIMSDCIILVDYSIDYN